MSAISQECVARFAITQKEASSVPALIIMCWILTAGNVVLLVCKRNVFAKRLFLVFVINLNLPQS